VKGEEDTLARVFKRRKRFVQVFYFKKGPVPFAARYEMELAGHMFSVGQGDLLKTVAKIVRSDATTPTLSYLDRDHSSDVAETTRGKQFSNEAN
jgi:hypothetical protein